MTVNETKTKSALSEVIQHWLNSCLDSNEPPAKTIDEIQTDSRTFFRYISKSTQVVTDSNIVLQTKSSHEESLAQLIQDLGPAFSQDHHRARLRALHVLVGALEGCKETQLSNTIVQLLGKFLLGHCGPVNDDDYGEDYDTMIRDASILALSSLVGVSTSSTQTDEELTDGITTRMELARSAVIRRCAVPDTTSATSDVYGFRGATSDMRHGLSTLPRSKRAMAFDLLQKTVTGIASIYQQMKNPIHQNELLLSNLQVSMVEFAKFTANCLQGESDPRCLLQLLKLIHNTQLALAPWFVMASTTPEAVFPIEDIFEAVAPYYPIQFSPPPNDIHGITREKLHKALLSVLTFTTVDPGVAKFNRQTMMTLSADLFLESLLPSPEDDNPGPLDKLEAVECLSTLLFPEPNSKVVDQMETRIAVSLSQALKVTHDEASLGVAQGGQMGKENKRLADQCRTLVSRLAFQLEQSPNKELWDIFVHQPLKNLSAKLSSAPASCKTSIAYMACLTASGGSRTLRECLTLGLQPLLDFMEHHMGDNEDTAAAAHGIGAFCSSCHAAMARAVAQGVVLHPHPLDMYADKVATLLLDTFEKKDMSPSITMGALRALECLLMASGSNQLSDSTMTRFCTFLDVVATQVTSHSAEEIYPELVDCFSMVLGNIIGGAVNEAASQSDNLLHAPTLKDHIITRIYPSLLRGIEDVSMDTAPQVLKVLSIASSCNMEIAEKIMGSCLALWNKSLKEKGINASNSQAQAVHFLLRNGGEMTLGAFHRSSSVDEIFEYLVEFTRSSTKEEIRASVANLSLPETMEEREAFQQGVLAVRQITSTFLPAFSSQVPQARLIKLLNLVSNILPPLSQEDSLQLCVWLPLLAAALQSSLHDDTMEANVVLDDNSSALVQGLTDVVTALDFDAETRSAAGACLYAVIARAKANTGCPVAPIITGSIAPTLSTTVDATTAMNALKILALLASAAASRGSDSSPTADRLVSFLLEIACKNGRLDLPFNLQSTNQFDSASFEDPTTIQLSAASAYGSILADSSLKPLMKQRLMYASFKFIKAAYEEERDQAKAGQIVKAPPVGLLVVVSHIICHSDFAKIDRLTLHQLCTLVVEGLSSEMFEQVNVYEKSPFSMASKNLVLAAVLKVICVAPTVVNGFSLSLVTGLLRAYAVCDPVSEVSCKLLALQGLEGVAHMEGTKSSTSTIKPAVVAVLAAAMNHPSGLLRQAAVDVRNAWYVLD